MLLIFIVIVKGIASFQFLSWMIQLEINEFKLCSWICC